MPFEPVKPQQRNNTRSSWIIIWTFYAARPTSIGVYARSTSPTNSFNKQQLIRGFTRFWVLAHFSRNHVSMHSNAGDGRNSSPFIKESHFAPGLLLHPLRRSNSHGSSPIFDGYNTHPQLVNYLKIISPTLISPFVFTKATTDPHHDHPVNRHQTASYTHPYRPLLPPAALYTMPAFPLKAPATATTPTAVFGSPVNPGPGDGGLYGSPAVVASPYPMPAHFPAHLNSNPVVSEREYPTTTVFANCGVMALHPMPRSCGGLPAAAAATYWNNGSPHESQHSSPSQRHLSTSPNYMYTSPFGLFYDTPGPPEVTSSTSQLPVMGHHGNNNRRLEMPVFIEAKQQQQHGHEEESPSTTTTMMKKSHRKGRQRSAGPLSSHAVYARLNRERRKKYIVELEHYRSAMRKRQVDARDILTKINEESRKLTEEIATLRRDLQRNGALMGLLRATRGRDGDDGCPDRVEKKDDMNGTATVDGH